MASERLLIQYLNEALAMERALVTTLTAHIAMTPRGEYRRLLERHLRETRGHAAALETRLDAPQHSSLLGDTIGLAESLVGQVLTLAKGPLDLLRGHGQAEKLLKNAKDECATEALEIATYDAIEAVAADLGDSETAALAAGHRDDEERMLADLRRLIPQLAGATVEDRTDPLPIAGYDDLNAGQIVARLSELSQADLARTVGYERAHRNRRTIVERAEALTADPPWEGYDEAGTQEILGRLDGASAGTVRDYESRHRRRVSVLEAAQRELGRS
jgi:ferritin-like metal-binding protein YciE